MAAPKLKAPAFLPSVFTSGNLFCGMLAVLEAARGHYLTASWLVVLAAAFDGVDGMAARLSGNTSRFGVEFDSLSDAISFVMAPALVIHLLALSQLKLLGTIAAFCFVVCGVIRLARFNVSQKNLLEKGAFSGLPVPAAGGLLVSYVIFCHRLSDGLCFPYLVPLFLLLLSLLMISRIEYPPLPKLTAKSFRSYLAYLLLLLALIGIVMRPQYMLFPLVGGYILYGLVKSLSAAALRFLHGFRSKNKKSEAVK
jgi:CDP-diacylglycerol--serine O-phosphatidyltransferase